MICSEKDVVSILNFSLFNAVSPYQPKFVQPPETVQKTRFNGTNAGHSHAAGKNHPHTSALSAHMVLIFPHTTVSQDIYCQVSSYFLNVNTLGIRHIFADTVSISHFIKEAPQKAIGMIIATITITSIVFSFSILLCCTAGCDQHRSE
jgi:hypothetical protein